jgi:hypothetical protein
VGVTDEPEPVTVERITVSVPCECGEIAKMRLTLEQAARYRDSLSAAIAGLEPAHDLVVRGSG